MRIKLFIAMFLIAVACFGVFWLYMQSNEIKSLRGDNNRLKSNNDVLINRLTKEHEDKVLLSERQKELENAIKSGKSNFNWNYDFSNDYVVLEFKRMHKYKD